MYIHVSYGMPAQTNLTEERKDEKHDINLCTNECFCCGLEQQCYRQCMVGLLRETFSVLIHVFGAP